MSREKFRTRFGFILVSAGCAIGIGNVWKFPYIAGENGGGVFVMFYLLFLLIMGIPVLTMELAIGRASRQSTVNAFRTLENPDNRWHYHGFISLAGCILLMMYYTTVSGWMLGYFFRFVSGTFEKSLNSALIFSEMLADPKEMILLMGITVIIGVAVCSMGLQNGTERVSKIMMTGMLILTAALAVNSLTLDGAAEGLRFFLLPDFGKAVENGIGNIMTAAMSQAFFSLSIGLASMEIFGSYMSKDNTLPSESVRICVLDTFVAVVSGIIIFPACFTFGIKPDSGPPLIFITLPKVFSDMANGRILGSLFFLFMSFASLSTVIAVCENLISAGIDTFGLSRKKASVICGVLLFTLSLPCIFGYNIWEDIKIIGGRNISDSEDFIVSNLLLPAGAIIYILFCTTKYGWGFDKYIKEANTGKGLKIPQKTKPYFQFMLPVLILIIFISSLR
ncbi:MAG: sodium-dependent transporter [Clostridia bacterium]|nr:sodium-dependent transporter [Clostridia bacterium]